jgi:hypothetical protein
MVPELYRMEDVAKMLGKSKRWLQDFLRGRPIGWRGEPDCSHKPI